MRNFEWLLPFALKGCFLKLAEFTLVTCLVLSLVGLWAYVMGVTP